MNSPLTTESAPPVPRRLFLAAGLAAIAAGGAVALGIMGQVTAPASDSFRFARGTSFANGEEDRLRGYLQPAVADDRMTVVIFGHSGSTGDAEANLALSEERAIVARDLALQLGIGGDRIQVSAMGGGAPLPQEAGESERAWQARLARVEITMQVRM